LTSTIVFAGDSITEAGRHGDPRNLGTGYVRLLADGPFTGRRIVNAGVAAGVSATYVALSDLLTRHGKLVGAHTLAADGVHPTPEGHRLIAAAWLDAYRSR
jgi:lysophospholipase L1-like esterase